MAFVRLAFFPGGTAAHYRALGEAIGENTVPPGRLLFAAGPVTGGWQVVQVWTGREDLDAFNAAVFLPALARVHDGFPNPPEVTDFETEDLMLGLT